jgi:hypothetical protein
MISLVLGLAVPWPALMFDAWSFITAVTTVSDNANSIECLLEGERDHARFFYGLLLAISTVPLVFVFFLAVYWLVIVRCCGDRRVLSCGTKVVPGPLLLRVSAADVTEDMEESWRKHFEPSTADTFIASSVFFWFLVLPSLVRVGAAAFQCLQIGEPDSNKPSYLAISLQEPCWEGRHLTFTVGVGFPMLVFYAAIVPGAIALRLRQLKASRLDNPHMMLRWGFFHSGYKLTKYWWELIVLLRKYCIIFASTFISSDTNQLQLVLGVVILALHMHDSHRPYGSGSEDGQQRTLHRFEMMSLLLLAFVVWCGLYFSSSSHLCKTTQEGWCILLSVMVLGLNAGYMLLLLGKCCREWKKRSFRRKPRTRSQEAQHVIEWPSGLTGVQGESKIAKGVRSSEIELFDDGDNSHGDNSQLVMNTNPLNTKAENKNKGDKVELELAARSSAKVKEAVSQELIDPASGRRYLWNKATGESTWL